MKLSQLKPAVVVSAILGCSIVAAVAFTPITSQQPGTTAEQTQPKVAYSAVQSPALGRELKFAILLPASYQKAPNRRYPVLYFLHGMNGNEGEFERRGVDKAVGRLREEGKIGDLIIVAPAGQNSFYLNAKNGAQYEDAIIKDLIPHVEKTYPAIGKQNGRAIQGLSMGGFGALTLAFKHPEMFASVSAHSSALFLELPNTSGTDRRSQFMATLVGSIFGNPPDEEFFRANNPMYLAETNASAIKKSSLKIYFDVGAEDRYGFQGANKQFDERLTKAGLQHEYHMFPGGHGWEYMISVANHSYEFLWKSFTLDKANSRASR
jgi:S-formylglutathione hydrolase FrmB